MLPKQDSFEVADRALGLVKRLCAAASPRAFELCFVHESGLNPALADELKRFLSGDTCLSEAQVDRLCNLFVSVDYRLFLEAERGVADLSTNLDSLIDTVSAAQKSAARFDTQLSALAGTVRGPAHPVDMARVITALLTAVHDMTSANKLFTQQVTSSMSEIDRLRDSLALARRETLLNPLTGIANRRHLETQLELAVETAHATGQPLALIVADIDHFKHFNDTYGHATGDQVLRLVSATMRDYLGPGALLARFGGEEFAIVLPNDGFEAALAHPEAIRSHVMTRELLKRSTGETLGRITISLGIAVILPGDTPETLLDRADQCMYQAKRQGRNRVGISATQPRGAVQDAA